MRPMTSKSGHGAEGGASDIKAYVSDRATHTHLNILKIVDTQFQVSPSIPKRTSVKILSYTIFYVLFFSFADGFHTWDLPNNLGTFTVYITARV